MQQNLLSNRTLPIITTTIEPRIDDMFATSEASPHMLTAPQTTYVITDAAHSSAHILRTSRHLIRTGRDSTTPGACNIDVIPLWDNSPVMIGGIRVLLTRRHSGSLEVLNKQQSTVSDKIGGTQSSTLLLIESWPMMVILCLFSAK